MRRAATVIFLLGAFVTISDSLLTFRLLSQPGFYEAYPPVRGAIDRFGLEAGLVGLTILVVACMGMLALAAVRYSPGVARVALVGLVLIVAARCGAVAWNVGAKGGLA